MVQTAAARSPSLFANFIFYKRSLSTKNQRHTRIHVSCNAPPNSMCKHCTTRSVCTEAITYNEKSVTDDNNNNDILITQEAQTDVQY
mmetsp:Transcript_9186/g.27362  ORF Transcript_9186/g.27362 Transcript_9186/m.27362 type:complete len:87 (-) Transcript_9186:1244-1504(-)